MSLPGSEVSAAASVRLVVSDLDGTLLDPASKVTGRSRAAVNMLRSAGIRFTLISARPPRGMKQFVEALNIVEPVVCFNGAVIASPQMEVLSQVLLARDVAEQVAGIILGHKLDLWAFVGCDWYATSAVGRHVANHIASLGIQPRPLASPADIVGSVAKLVGVSDDFPAVQRCEQDVLQVCGQQVSATRSKDYYLDVTHRDADKGDGTEHLSRQMGIPLEEIASIGDMPTDALMFRRTGISIAMGNASDEVKAQARFVTASNAEEGFAVAMERFVLARASVRTAGQPA